MDDCGINNHSGLISHNKWICELLWFLLTLRKVVNACNLFVIEEIKAELQLVSQGSAKSILNFCLKTTSLNT